MAKSFTRIVLERFCCLLLNIAVIFSILYISHVSVAQRLLGEFIHQFNVLCYLTAMEGIICYLDY